jgi:hypothetical protein
MKNIYLKLFILFFLTLFIFFLSKKDNLDKTNKELNTSYLLSYEKNGFYSSQYIKEKSYSMERNNTNLNISNKDSIEKSILEWFSSIANIPLWNGTDYKVKNLEGQLYIDEYFFIYDLINKYDEPLIIITVKNLNNNYIFGYAKVSLEDNNNYKLNSFVSLSEYNRTSFPTISEEEAKQIILEERNLSLDLNYQNEIVHIAGSLLLHFYTNKDQNFYFDIENGYIYDDKFIENYINNKIKEKEKELQFHLDKQGQLVLDTDFYTMKKYYSDKEIDEISKELEVSNQAIRDGLLKLDENLNLIFDKRK